MNMGNLERNSYVRKQITLAILSLLEEKEMKRITIEDISKRAEVSRISFYRNYNDKEDIIRAYIADMIVEWQMNNPAIKEKTEAGYDDKILGSLFGLLREHSDFYLLLSRRGLLHLVRDALKEIYGPKPEYANFHAYTAAFIFCGIYGWIEEWIPRGMPESKEEMTELLRARNLSV